MDEYEGRATLVALIRLRMFCAHPLLTGSNTSDPAIDCAKDRRLVEILEEIFSNEEKAVLFSSFNAMSDIVVTDISHRFGVYVSNIDGRTPMGDRQPIIDTFSKVAGGALLVLNPRAAGTGNSTSLRQITSSTTTLNGIPPSKTKPRHAYIAGVKHGQ